MRKSELLQIAGAITSVVGATVIEVTMIPVIAGLAIMGAGLGGEAIEEKKEMDARRAYERRRNKRIDFSVGGGERGSGDWNAAVSIPEGGDFGTFDRHGYFLPTGDSVDRRFG